MREFVLGAVFLGILCMAISNVAARWKPEYAAQSEAMRNWYSSQRNAKGTWCCDDGDGHRYDGSVKMLPDGSVQLDGGVIIPEYMVLKGPNPTGHAVWWYIINWNGNRTDYCFALPTMG